VLDKDKNTYGKLIDRICSKTNGRFVYRENDYRGNDYQADVCFTDTTREEIKELYDLHFEKIDNFVDKKMPIIENLIKLEIKKEISDLTAIQLKGIAKQLNDMQLKKD